MVKTISVSKSIFMTKILSFLLLLFIPFLSKANITDWYKIKADKAGNIYVLGAYNGRATIGPYSFGDSLIYPTPITTGYFLVKYDSSGTLLRADSIVGINSNCFGPCPGYIGMVIDNDNNVIISMSASDSTIYRGISYYRPNILKLDTAGNVILAKHVGSPYFTETDISVDGKNNIYYASTFADTVSSDTVRLHSCDSTSIKTFVVKMLPDGTTKWIREIASSIAGYTVSLQECYFIATDSMGNSYIGGMTDNTIALGSEMFTCAGFYPFLAKLDSNGNSVFLKGYLDSWIGGPAGATHSYLSDGCISNSQKLYNGGSFRDTVHVGPSSVVVTNSNVITPYLGCTDVTNGNATWYQYNQLLSTTSFDNRLYSVAADNNDNTYIIGDIYDGIYYYNGSGLSTLVTNPSRSYFAKFNSSGNFQCYSTDSARLIAGTTYGSNYYTVGMSSTSTYMPNYEIRHASVKIIKWDGNNCMAIWKDSLNSVIWLHLEGTTGLVRSQPNFIFAPNPSSTGIFTPRTTSNVHYSVEVFDLLGRKIKDIENQSPVDLSAYARGLYIYKVTFADRTVLSGKILYQ